MRKTKIIKIDDKEITVRELKIKDIRKIFAMSETNNDDFLGEVETMLPLVTDIDTKELDDMAPSEIKMLWEAFKEVNADFLALLERLGIIKTFESLIRKHLTETFADSSSTGTPKSLNMDGASSLRR